MKTIPAVLVLVIILPFTTPAIAHPVTSYPGNTTEVSIRESIEKLAQANLRLAAVYRRQNQSEVAVPLLVEVVKLMTPSTVDGRKAYQQLVEVGFVSTPYAAPAAAATN